ncbi:MAG: hypothetical protein P4L90_12305 [Rhodopila sp.]|nr:hypothetical protein [Rhodopila sp.]
MRAEAANLANIILIAAMSGCATSGPPPTSPPATAAPVSFDGSYQGTIRLTSEASTSVQNNWCDTPPVMSVSVQNGAFSYVMPHPNLPQGQDHSLSLTFAVTVAPDGSFDASTVNGGAEMTGHITGSRMVGQINGSGCGYAFTADRS